MYKDIFESIRNEAEKRNLRERTIQLYLSLIHISLHKKNICIHRCDIKPLSFLLHLDFLM